MICELSLSYCLYLLFSEGINVFIFLLVFKMCVLCVLRFSSIVPLTVSIFQICWLTRIHSTHTTEMDYLRKHDRDRKGKAKCLNGERDCLWWGEGDKRMMLTNDRIILWPAVGGGRTSGSFKHFLIIFYMPDRVLGVRVIEFPWSLQNFHIFGDCINFLLLSYRKYYYRPSGSKWQKGQKSDKFRG